MRQVGIWTCALAASLVTVSMWSAGAQSGPKGGGNGGPGMGPAGGPPPPPPPPGGGGNGGGGNGGGGNGGGGNGGGAGALGQPVAGLDATSLALFNSGKNDFQKQEGIADGLGPVFNARSCGECHAAPAPGGFGVDPLNTTVIRFGRVTNGVYDELASLGGPVIQRRSIKEINPACPIVGEKVPAQANVVSPRATPPLYGLGLLEAVPAATILAAQDPTDKNGDGIRGVANFAFNPETGETEVGRFGWKGQSPTLHLFAGEAYRNELGITTPSFPQENQPQGQPIPKPWDPVADPEEVAGVDVVASFMRYLAPPAPRASDANTQRGSIVFTTLGCAACHTPTLKTGGSDPALANKTISPYTDLLLHDMGPALADGITMGNAKGGQWRTTPLWGTGLKRRWLHDNRADSLQQAITIHDGEARGSVTRFNALSPADRNALLAFLNSL